MKLNALFLDLETSGIDPANDRIIEVCAMRVHDGEIVAIFNSMVFFDGDLSHDIAKATGHTLEDTKRGLDEKLVAEILWQMLLGDSPDAVETIVAYNAIFDMSFLHHVFMRNIHGYDELFYWNFIDPLTILRDRKSYPHRLAHACQHYGVAQGQWHSAHDDVLALIEVTKAMDKEKDISEYVNVLGYMAKYGAPEWYPEHATLKPQGSVTVHHNPPKKGKSIRSSIKRPTGKSEASADGNLDAITKQMLDRLLVGGIGGTKTVGVLNEELEAVMEYLMSKGIPEHAIYADPTTPAECDVSIEKGYEVQEGGGIG